MRATGFMMSDLFSYRHERRACKYTRKNKSQQSTHYSDASLVRILGITHRKSNSDSIQYSLKINLLVFSE